ncbi:MAG: Lrp/AsnC family transcriptional regulator [Alphaproteobacteria bacterium]|nr:Lrp/AsnC family transcriptional regulator [Alphaproteobacteria bacterium]MBF0251100.1 Lrp/AsnC family transcriptional regulator [Alphaproteobacteria bacterium]
MDYDDLDLKIIDQLQEDARQTNLALAEKVGLSPTPCARRVRNLEDQGVIKGYRAVVDLHKLGVDLTIFVGVKVERHQDDEAASFVDAVTGWPEVLSCHLVSGDIDFLLEVVAANMEDYERFVLQRLLKIRSVKDVRSNFAMRTYKSGGPAPVRRLCGK